MSISRCGGCGRQFTHRHGEVSEYDRNHPHIQVIEQPKECMYWFKGFTPNCVEDVDGNPLDGARKEGGE